LGFAIGGAAPAVLAKGFNSVAAGFALARFALAGFWR
jgi:hypothetical protein